MRLQTMPSPLPARTNGNPELPKSALAGGEENGYGACGLWLRRS